MQDHIKLQSRKHYNPTLGYLEWLQSKSYRRTGKFTHPRLNSGLQATAATPWGRFGPITTQHNLKTKTKTLKLSFSHQAVPMV